MNGDQQLKESISLMDYKCFYDIALNIILLNIIRK